jgi:Uma2 family endonuclease
MSDVILETPPAPVAPPVPPRVLPVLPPERLPETDGEPLETPWHRDAMNLMIEVIQSLLGDRTDYFVGGNMFVYFSMKQVRRNDFRGPDVFLVRGADGTRPRDYWAVWDEDGRYPDLIIELLSSSTAEVDRTTKKAIYEQTFRTPEYYCYDPAERRLEGWRLGNDLRYHDLAPNDRGWLWSEQLGAWLGTWEGLYQRRVQGVWLRLFEADGRLVPLFAEAAEQRAEATEQRAEAERQRAEAAEAELARLRALLADQGGAAPPG